MECPSSHTVRVRANADEQLKVYLFRIVPLDCTQREPETRDERVEEDGSITINIKANVDCVQDAKTPVAVIYNGAAKDLTDASEVAPGVVEGTFSFDVAEMAPATWHEKKTPDTYYALAASQVGEKAYLVNLCVFIFFFCL